MSRQNWPQPRSSPAIHTATSSQPLQALCTASATQNMLHKPILYIQENKRVKVKWGRRRRSDLQEKQVAVDIRTVPMSQLTDNWTTNVAVCKLMTLSVRGASSRSSWRIVCRWRQRKASIKHKQISNPFFRAYIFKIMRNSSFQGVQVLKTSRSSIWESNANTSH